MSKERQTRDCPYCREEIDASASRCKHCGSSVVPKVRSHGGTCPYCREEIHEEASKCKHCRSDLTGETELGGGRSVGLSELAYREMGLVEAPFGDVEGTGKTLYRSRFPSTLPKCRWVPEICGSSLPGYPPIVCGYKYVCRIGNTDVVISQNADTELY